MSKKHLNAIAAAIKNRYSSAVALRDLPGQSTVSHEVGAARCFGIIYAAEAVADACAASNPAFDRNRFLTACGVVGGDK